MEYGGDVGWGGVKRKPNNVGLAGFCVVWNPIQVHLRSAAKVRYIIFRVPCFALWIHVNLGLLDMARSPASLVRYAYSIKCKSQVSSITSQLNS
jgi:hypothetical protein